MPVQASLVTCQSGAWTPVAEYMERRQSLMIQCPELAPTVNEHNASITDGTPSPIILTANPLRTAVLFCWRLNNGPLTFATLWPNGIPDPSGNHIGIDARTDGEYAVTQPELAALQWQGNSAGTAPWTLSVSSHQTLQVCSSIILGIVNTTPTVAGPAGTTPIGLWESPDLSSGGSEFRLTRSQDYDLVSQEWFAYPVGTGNVQVQVYQTYEAPDLDAVTKRSTTAVKLPRLSRGATGALKDLLARFTQLRGE